MPEITLYQIPPLPGQDSGSPFSTKVHRLLCCKGLAYRPKDAMNPFELKRLNPRARKLPVLGYDGELVADSSRIAALLEERHPAPSLWPADPQDRVLAHLLEDWADESLYWFAVYHRWAIDTNFAPFARHAFGAMPPPMRWIVPGVARRTVRKQLHGQGLGRSDYEQVRAALVGHLDALKTRLGARSFLVGDTLSLADIAVFAPLQALHTPGLPESRELVRERESLVSWAKRIDEATAGEHTATFE